VIIAIVIPAAVVTSRNKSSSDGHSGAPDVSQGSASNDSGESADQGSAADGPVAGSTPRPV